MGFSPCTILISLFYMTEEFVFSNGKSSGMSSDFSRTKNSKLSMFGKTIIIVNSCSNWSGLSQQKLHFLFLLDSFEESTLYGHLENG